MQLLVCSGHCHARPKGGEARRHFEFLLKLANDVGLLPEEYDVGRKRFVGNFPQAFSHVGLVNAACAIAGEGGPAELRQQG